MAVQNFFRPGQLWPDNHGLHINAHGGGVLFRAGVYYWFGEYKITGEEGNAAQAGVHVYSSTDLYNWKDEGADTLVWLALDAPQSLRGSFVKQRTVIPW